MKYLIKYSNYIKESINNDLHKIQSDWKKVGLRNCFLLQDLMLYEYVDDILQVRTNGFMPVESTTDESINTFKCVIDDIKKDLNLNEIKYYKISNFAIIFIADNMILKVFSDRLSDIINEYKFAKSMVGKKINGLVEYKETWVSKCKFINGKLMDGPIYAILMEKCDELNDKDKSLFNKFHSVLKLDKKSKTINKEEMLYTLKGLTDQIHIVNEFVDLFFELKGKVELDDFRGDNLGRVEGKLTHFDPMNRDGFS